MQWCLLPGAARCEVDAARKLVAKTIRCVGTATSLPVRILGRFGLLRVGAAGMDVLVG